MAARRRRAWRILAWATVVVVLLAALTAGAGWWLAERAVSSLTVVDLDQARQPVASAPPTPAASTQSAAPTPGASPSISSGTAAPSPTSSPTQSPTTSPTPSPSPTPTPTETEWPRLPSTDGLPMDVLPHEVYLLVGGDTRQGSNGDVVPGHGRRVADVIMLATVAEDGSWAYLLSITRDTVITYPQVTACGDYAGVEERINTSWAAGGVLCTVAVVEELTGLRVDHVAAIEFAGFVSAIDILGGVTVCLDEAISDPYTGLELSAGTHRLDGETALDFARARKGTMDGGGDIGRNLRQQHLMRQVLAEAQGSDLLRNPKRAWDTIQALMSSMTVDEGLASAPAIVGLLKTLSDVDRSRITTMAYPTSYHPTVEWGRQPLYDDAAYALYPLVTGQDPPDLGGTGAAYLPDWMSVTCG